MLIILIRTHIIAILFAPSESFTISPIIPSLTKNQMDPTKESSLFSSKASSRRKGGKKDENSDRRNNKNGFHQRQVGSDENFEGNHHHTSLSHQQRLSIEKLPPAGDVNHSNGNRREHGIRQNHHVNHNVVDLQNLQGHHVNDHGHGRQLHHQNPMSKFLSHIIPPQENNKLVSATKEWKKLSKHTEFIEGTHLRNLIQDEERCDELYAEYDGLYLDYSRQRVTLETMDMLYDLAEKQNLKRSIDAMMQGEKINWTEDRAVLHTALRGERPADGEENLIVDGENVMEEVWEVLDQIKYFTEAVRSGEIRGFTGKRLRNIISVGIGGSYLGPEFLHECLKTEPDGINKSLGYTLRFLSNVDPVDVERACADLDPEETLVVIVSKTFTTAETMLNARTTRQWLWDFMGDDKGVVQKHMVAVSSISSIEKVEAFGIDTKSYFFRFWDWVGGRYSVCSAVGGIPISLLYGFDLFEKFLKVRLYSVRICYLGSYEILSS